MHFIPNPTHVTMHEGFFVINKKTKLDVRANLYAGRLLKSHLEVVLGFDVEIGVTHKNGIVFLLEPTEWLYEIEVNVSGLFVKASSEEGFFYAVQTLKQMITQTGRHLPCLKILDKPLFEHRGYYYDVTRGKVPTLTFLKSLVDMAASFKLNQIQLYVEHTFLFPNQSEVWTVTDPLTAEEIILLDQYCAERYIELVPSISTFGHLYEALQSSSFQHLGELEPIEGFSWVDRMNHHTLNVSLEESIEFVKGMIDAFVPLVRSRHFNICADETFDLGNGKNKDLAAQIGKSDMYVTFLNKIVHHVKSHGKQVMFWGDIILKHPEQVERLPKDLICLNWWYWLNYPEEKVSTIASYGFQQYLCPGVNGWNLFMNNQRMAYDNIKLMTSYAERYNALGILNTDWGDYGHVNAFSCSIPGLIYGAAFSWGENRSFEALNEAIDEVYFETRQSVVSYLDQMAQCQHVSWLALVRYMEKGITDVLDKITVDDGIIMETDERLTILESQLLDLLSVLPVSKRKHVEAYLVAVEAIRLSNHLYLHISNRDYGKNYTLIESGEALAQAFEYWLLDFKKQWLIENKPSELYRVVAFVQKINLYLRRSSL